MIHSVYFAVGEEVVLEDRLKALQEIGYKRQPEVSDPATFTHRGGILDVFPWGHSFPVRVEFFDDTVESIYSYDLSSGSLLEPHKTVVILPVSERTSLKRLKKIQWDWGEKPLQPFVDLEPDDLVVHVSHGIGRFRGVEKIKNQKDELAPHLIIEYQDDEKLYVPFSELYLVQRYIAPGIKQHQIKLSKLGSKMWVKVREKVRKAILSYATDLLDMQAKRELLEGHAFEEKDSWEKELSESFPYRETKDQAQAIIDTYQDMVKKKPMDRLICGDVGYGKTEVAIRAVFRSIINDKQAAILVPTTLLAEQHYITLKERFKNFPVQVEMLSRFQTKSQQKAILERLSNGSCDVVVGTHRLLSQDVSFKDLGLIIVDEEQRFGVKHKERLKQYRYLVDVLSMSATPIPRTLYIALLGGKDVSMVNTPPDNRIAIKTQVLHYDEDIIKKGIEKELKRGGQIFFVHNRVMGIEKIALDIKKLVPQASISVAHGQMDAKNLEDVMKKFINGDIDVLVATTIIESGIDIPNANTIFVNRADAFGLSELYQLKGRVGRHSNDAYAYFLIPKGAVLTHESQRRLHAIEKHSHLGAGFNIAMEDLEIRGAGNLLGTQQSGFVHSIGFDLYCRLLKDAINSLKTKLPSLAEEPRAI